MKFWKSKGTQALPVAVAASAARGVTPVDAVAAPEHRVFYTHRDAIELWGIVRDEDYVAGVSYEEVFSLNDDVTANGVAK